MEGNVIHSEVFDYTWKQYRKWAATSRIQKSAIMKWRIFVLILLIIGAICGAISATEEGDSTFSLMQLVSYTGAIALGLSAFFNTQALSRDREQRWILARSIAEACKSEIFKYRVSGPPYDTEQCDRILRKRIDNIVGKANQISPVILSDKELLADIDRQPLNAESYIEQRVKQQRDSYYLPAAKKNADIMKWGRAAGIGFGAVAAILSALTTAVPDTTHWVAVISTVTASITAFLFSGRYNYLAISYQTTADRLEQILLDWNLEKEKSGASADFHPFMAEFENAISIENNAWVAEYKKKTESIVPTNEELSTES